MRNAQQLDKRLALSESQRVESGANLKHLGPLAVAVCLTHHPTHKTRHSNRRASSTCDKKLESVGGRRESSKKRKSENWSMASNAATLQKLQYQLKKAETDVEGWKRKEKAKRDEFLALQQGVTNKQKQLQQRINRLEQEVLEGKRARDVLQREYQVTLQQVIDLGKADDKSALLAQTVERQASELSELRAISEANASLAKDWETKALANQTACDLARTEKEAAVRAAEETEVAARQVRELLKEERSGAGAGVGAGAGGKPLKGKTCLVFGGGKKEQKRNKKRAEEKKKN